MPSRRSQSQDDIPMGRRQRREIFVVVAYDIPNDRRRLKVMKLLEGYGQRVQYSVFECFLQRQSFTTMKNRLRSLIDAKEDDVRFYELCGACQRNRAGLGKGKPQSRKHFVVV